MAPGLTRVCLDSLMGGLGCILSQAVYCIQVGVFRGETLQIPYETDKLLAMLAAIQAASAAGFDVFELWNTRRGSLYCLNPNKALKPKSKCPPNLNPRP